MSSVSKQLTAASLQDAKVYVIPAPINAYTDAEIAVLKKYVANGGSVMMICGSDFKDLSKPGLLNKISKAIGGHVYFNDD